MIGDQLADSYKQTFEWYASGLKLTEDLAEFYRERAAIERESAQRLQQLAAKHFNKKAALSSAVSVGPHPATTPGSLENSTLETWTLILNQTEQIAAYRKQLADQITGETVADLGALVSKWNGIGESIGQVHSSTTQDLAKCVSTVKTHKQQYDEACAAMEKSRAKGSKKIDQKEEQMIQVKNSYLLSLAVGNRVQQKHFYDDEPELLDAIEAAWRARTAQINRIWKHEQQRQTEYLGQTTEALKICTEQVNSNNPMNDVQMFVKHNTKPWPGPQEMRFEPSPLWHDEPEFDTSEAGLRFLRARLSKADADITPATNTSQDIMDRFEASRTDLARADFDSLGVGSVASLMLDQLAALKQLVAAETQRVGIETELETIEEASKGKDLASVPVTRTKTKRTVFGKKKEVVEVVDTTAPTLHTEGFGIKSLLARKTTDKNQPTATILYNFESGAPGELTVFEGEVLALVQRDDGSGWVKVRKGTEEGVVPAAYCEVVAPAPPPSRNSVKTVTALYDFQGQDESQLSLKKGESIVVVEDDPGNGWTTGKVDGRSGLFPTSYAS